MVRFLRAFAYVWLGHLVLLILVGIAGAFMTMPVLEHVSRVQYWFSPFNLWNWGTIVVLCAPGGGALLLAYRLEARRY